jgi:hypothetical protein
VLSNIKITLTLRGLAIWICDDGTWAGSSLYLATHFFSLAEVQLLVSVLHSKFNLNCLIHKNKGAHQIYIRTASIPHLRILILPFFIPSMQYKFGL